jgi:uncharacterized protein
MDAISPETHVAIMARMVLKSQGQKIGRTQLMKLCYFLQEIEQAPIKYDFRLFNYGPFDSEVLNDLGTACSQNTLKEQTVIYNRGYGYEITPGESAEELSGSLNPELAKKVDRVVQAFFGEGAGELELKSTILFVDREFTRDNTSADVETIATRVQSIKPHFTLDTIRDRISTMKDKGFLHSLSVN